MSEFRTGSFDPAFRSSQKTVSLLENVSAADLALSIPHMKITRVDESGQLADKSLNLIFTKPPEFGDIIGDRQRYGERPPVSLRGMTVSTEQQHGLFILQRVELDVIVHRPDAIFTIGKNNLPSGDSEWTSLITPGSSHLIEYGWRGSCKNPLFNGEGYTDDNAKDRDGSPILIDSVKELLFTTYYYTFNIMNNGEIEIKISGWHNGDFFLRRTLLTENKSKKQLTGKGRITSVDSTFLESVRKDMQLNVSEMKELARRNKKSKPMIKIVDFFNKMKLGQTINELSKQWGYKRTRLLMGQFNDLVPLYTSKKYGSISLRGKSIGEFQVPLDDISADLGKVLELGSSLTIRPFMERFISVVNKTDSWSNEQGETTESYRIPSAAVKVVENRLRDGGRELVVIVFDVQREAVILKSKDPIIDDGTRSNTREKVKKRLRDRNVPFVSLGKGTAFIKNSNFEVILDNDIQRVKIDEAASFIRDRAQVVGQTQAETLKSKPESFHQIWSSAIQGSVTMLGNFAFDTFGSMWIDFGVPLWDGLFNIRKKTDEISSGRFESTIEVYSEGIDPFNTRARKSLAVIELEDQISKAKIDRSRNMAAARGQKERKAAEQLGDQKIARLEEMLKNI